MLCLVGLRGLRQCVEMTCRIMGGRRGLQVLVVTLVVSAISGLAQGAQGAAVIPEEEGEGTP